MAKSPKAEKNENAAVTPKVGLDILYVLESGETVPGKVVEVLETDPVLCNLEVMQDGAKEARNNTPQDPTGGTIFTWHAK